MRSDTSIENAITPSLPTTNLTSDKLEILNRDVATISFLLEKIELALPEFTMSDDVDLTLIIRLFMTISRGVSTLSCAGSMLKMKHKDIPWVLLEYIKLAEDSLLHTFASAEKSSHFSTLKALQVEFQKCLENANEMREKLSPQIRAVSKGKSVSKGLSPTEEKRYIEELKKTTLPLIDLCKQKLEEFRQQRKKYEQDNFPSALGEVDAYINEFLASHPDNEEIVKKYLGLSSIKNISTKGLETINLYKAAKVIEDEHYRILSQTITFLDGFVKKLGKGEISPNSVPRFIREATESMKKLPIFSETELVRTSIIRAISVMFDMTISINHALHAHEELLSEEVNKFLMEIINSCRIECLNSLEAGLFDENLFFKQNLAIFLSDLDAHDVLNFIRIVTTDLHVIANFPLFKARLTYFTSLIDFAEKFYSGNDAENRLEELKICLLSLDKLDESNFLEKGKEILKKFNNDTFNSSSTKKAQPGEKPKKGGKDEVVDAEKLVVAVKSDSANLFAVKKTQTKSKTQKDDTYSEVLMGRPIPATLFFTKEPLKYLAALRTAYQTCTTFDAKIEKSSLDSEEIEVEKEKVADIQDLIIRHYQHVEALSYCVHGLEIKYMDWLEVADLVYSSLEKFPAQEGKMGVKAELLDYYEEREPAKGKRLCFYGFKKIALVNKHEEIIQAILNGKIQRNEVDAYFQKAMLINVQANQQLFQEITKLDSRMLAEFMQDKALVDLLGFCLHNLILLRAELNTGNTTLENTSQFHVLHEAIAMEKEKRLIDVCISAVGVVLENASQLDNLKTVRLAALQCICFLGETHKKLPHLMREKLRGYESDSDIKITQWRKIEILRNLLYHDATQITRNYRKYQSYLETGAYSDSNISATKKESNKTLDLNSAVKENLQEAIQRVLYYENMLHARATVEYKNNEALLMLAECRVLSDVGDWIPKLAHISGQGMVDLIPIQKCLSAFNAGHEFEVDATSLNRLIQSVSDLLGYIKLSRNTVAHNFFFTFHVLSPLGESRVKQLEEWRSRKKAAKKEKTSVTSSSPESVMPMTFLYEKFVPVLQLCWTALMLVDQKRGDLLPNYLEIIRAERSLFAMNLHIPLLDIDEFEAAVIGKICGLLKEFAVAPVVSLDEDEKDIEREKCKEKEEPEEVEQMGIKQKLGLFGLFACGVEQAKQKQKLDEPLVLELGA